jgi:hypothetical protein
MKHKPLCLTCKNKGCVGYCRFVNPQQGRKISETKKEGTQMIKLYRDAQHPKNWVAYVPTIGWLAFPATENGWEQRSPARGLDPLFLREVPIQKGFAAGMPQPELLRVA